MDAERWLRLSPLLDALLELPPDQRAEHLAALRREDEALAAELERLLSLEEADVDFLSEPVVELPSGARPGARIGPYRLDRLIGEGGMGQVWLAARADGLYDRKVALKLLRPGLADPKLRQRFDREREILARFAHPFIARLLDAGIDQDGQPYLALEYVEGEPITDYCRSRQLEIPARLDLFRQVCEAVSHAHANLIVHRDLKPSNILVTPAGQVRLLDFGIAKLLDVERPPVEHTRTGVRTFTLHYAAPEQIRGEPVTTMTDVYALGVVLYELLTGNKPYRLKRQTDAEWEEAILVGDPLRPSQAAARLDAAESRPYTPPRLARALAGDLDNITLKALAKQPERRYVSVEALSHDILNYLRGRPVAARGEGLAYRAGKYIRRHRWAITACTSILMLLFSALMVVSWQAQRAQRETTRAQAMQRFVADLFEDAGSSPNTPMDLRNLLDMGILRGEHSLAKQPQSRAELYGVVARLRLGLGDYRQADDLLRRQAALLDSLRDAPASLHLESATLHGNAFRQLGNVQACTDAMLPLEDMAIREEGRLPVQAAAFYSQLGRCQREMGKTQVARQLYLRSLQLRRQEREDTGIAENMLDLATLESDGGNPQAAIRILDDALTQLHQSSGGRHPLAIDILRSRCSLLRNMDNVTAASRDCRAALELARELRGRNHRATVDANRQLAALFVDQGRFSEAETIFIDALAWMRARLDPIHPDMARAYNSLAIVAWERGDIGRALVLQRQAVSSWRQSGNAGLLASGLFNLALILHGAGRDAEALEPARQALRLRQTGNSQALVGDSQRLLGEILWARGQHAEALVMLEAAVRATRAGFGSGHSHTRRAEIALARARALQGEPEAALRLQRLAQAHGDSLEQRKTAWLARAYASEADCRNDPPRARGQLDAILAQMQLALPEGGAVPREVQGIRKACLGGIARR